MIDERTYFAKIENGIVVSMRVVSWEFLVANPERYGDSSLWIEYYPDGSGRGWCAMGWSYDAVHDVFVAPTVEGESDGDN